MTVTSSKNGSIEIEPSFAYDMPKETLAKIMKAWSISEDDLKDFIEKYEIEKRVIERIGRLINNCSRPVNRFSPQFQREVKIRGAEELINFLYRQGKRPRNLRIEKSEPNAFHKTCIAFKDRGEKILIPILPTTPLNIFF
jgi:hypothetical protein